MPSQETAQSSEDDIENDLNLSMAIKMAKYGYCLIGIALKVEAGWTPCGYISWLNTTYETAFIPFTRVLGNIIIAK